jgi:hypothetical protein
LARESKILGEKLFQCHYYVDLKPHITVTEIEVGPRSRKQATNCLISGKLGCVTQEVSHFVISVPL